MFIDLLNVLDINFESETFLLVAGKLTLLAFNMKKQYFTTIIIKGKATDIVLMKRIISYLVVIKIDN